MNTRTAAHVLSSKAGEPTAAPRPRALPVDVVSVQSQVVYGHVGNSVAVPCLQAQGLTVATVPTVVLSNTPDYPSLHGGALPRRWFEGYLNDLRARGALRQVRAILTGYLGSADQARAVARWLATPEPGMDQALRIVDPVMGDHDTGLYVAPQVAQAVRRHLLPQAHGLTPNSFELQWLSGQPATSLEQTVAAARQLMHAQTRWVVVTSALQQLDSPMLHLVVVTPDQSMVLQHPRLPIKPHGTGDLFNALLAGALLRGTPIFDAAQQACDQLQQVLADTLHANCDELVLHSLPRMPALSAGAGKAPVAVPSRRMP